MWSRPRPRFAIRYAATGLSMPPGQHIEGAAGGSDRQTALTLYFGAVDIRTVIADLHDDLKLRVLDVHPQ